MPRALSILPIALLLAACGSDSPAADAGYDCTQEDRRDIYSAGMSRSGASGYEVVLIDSRPSPPQKDNNDWTLEIREPGGAVTTSVDLVVEPFMPDHLHGTPIVAVVTPPEEGEDHFEASPINLWMPGLWRVSVFIHEEGTRVDTIEFFFCIDG